MMRDGGSKANTLSIVLSQTAFLHELLPVCYKSLASVSFG